MVHRSNLVLAALLAASTLYANASIAVAAKAAAPAARVASTRLQ